MKTKDLASAAMTVTGCSVEHLEPGWVRVIDPADDAERLVRLRADIDDSGALPCYEVSAWTELEDDDIRIKIGVETSDTQLERAIAWALIRLEERCHDLAWTLDHRSRSLREIRPSLRDL